MIADKILLLVEYPCNRTIHDTKAALRTIHDTTKLCGQSVLLLNERSVRTPSKIFQPEEEGAGFQHRSSTKLDMEILKSAFERA